VICVAAAFHCFAQAPVESKLPKLISLCGMAIAGIEPGGLLTGANVAGSPAPQFAYQTASA
jgi:hypothetical protein